MKKKRKDTSNLIFSAFLITAFVICSYFFNLVIQDSLNVDTVWKNLLRLSIFVIFGLLLFYATRIGDGKQIKRFSISTLILMDLPALYIIVASAWDVLPFHTEIASCTAISFLAAVVLGYGIPYTFLSGYEQELPTEEEDNDLDEDENKDETDEFDEDLDEDADDALLETLEIETIVENNANTDNEDIPDSDGTEPHNTVNLKKDDTDE